MSRIQNGRNRNHQKSVPGCLGRMVNLFDLNTAVGRNRLLTDKPHRDGPPLSRLPSDVSRTSLPDGQMDDELIMSGLRKSPSNRTSHGTPIKKLIAQEMSREMGPTQSPPNLVAKLMGLDAIPHQTQPCSASRRNHARGSRSQSGSLEFLQQEHGFLDTEAQHDINPYPEQGEYKDVYEIWQQSCEPDYMRVDSPQKGRYVEPHTNKKMALVREKFMEAKRLSTDENLRQSQQFQDALEVLSSNKDLFLKFLQEPNSLFSQHLYNSQSVPPPPDSRRITVLRPSKLVDSDKIIGSGRKNEKQVKETAQMDHLNVWEKSSSTFSRSPECYTNYDSSQQLTRIVVLKPSSGKPHDIKDLPSPPSSSLRTSNDDEFFGDPEGIEAMESREVAKESMSENCESLSALRRDETLLSSVFSNGYIGDESSFSKSEVDYAAGNLSDSEVVSPASRHSWDYINQFDSPYSTTSFSRASYSPESSVCREAKKRLSERWAMMASNKGVQEQRHIRRNSSTLGEMLALSDLKKPVKSDDENTENKEQSRVSTSFLTSDLKKVQDADRSPRNLTRSRSLPASGTSSDSRIGVEVSHSLKGKADDTKDTIKEKGVKSSSFKGKVSSLFFSKNRKSSKEKAHQSKDEPQSVGFPVRSPLNIGSDRSQCSEQESCTGGLHRSSGKAYSHHPPNAGLQQGLILPEAGFSFTKTETCGNPNENQDQPSPISVLESLFEDDEHTTVRSRNAKINDDGPEPMKFNLIDKSPPIGSIARTLSLDDSGVGPATPYPGKPAAAPLTAAEEEQQCYVCFQALLAAAALDRQVRPNSFLARWHSPESPLDPSLRDKYMSLRGTDPILTPIHPTPSICKLVFDCVNEALMDITCCGPHGGLEYMAASSVVLVDALWARVKEWISGEKGGGNDEEDGGGGGSVVVERVVRKEVVGWRWVEHLRLESDDIRKEIEGKLLEEVVHECVLELTGRM